MRVKAVDIARKLNISKATVSLALNNKPGVSEETRRLIFQCMNDLSGGAETVRKEQTLNKKMIKIIAVNNHRNHLVGLELEIGRDTWAVFDQEIKQQGYTLGITYVELGKDDVDAVINAANQEEVAGVILYATEMDSEDLEQFRRIRKPMVVYDNDLGNDYPCVVLDGVDAVRNLVDLLAERGCRDIRYLGNQVPLFNFQQRRAGYRAGLRKNRLELTNDSIILIGDTINNVYENMKKYLETTRLPDAFIMENFQVSIGVVRAMREYGISIPQDVSIVGIDEVPSYMTGELPLSMVRVDHAERAYVAMLLLEQAIQGLLSTKLKVFSCGEFIPGMTVR